MYLFIVNVIPTVHSSQCASCLEKQTQVVAVK